MNTHIKVQTVNGEELAFSRNPSGSIDVLRVHRGSKDRFNGLTGKMETVPSTEHGQPFDEKITTVDASETPKLATFFAQLA